MRWQVILAAIVASTITCDTSWSVDFLRPHRGKGVTGHACRCDGQSACSCPDDYCPKPFPEICLPCRPSCPDDYCPKPCPATCLPCRCGCPDDYCEKPLPCVRPLACRDDYRCPPPACGCDGGRHGQGRRHPLVQHATGPGQHGQLTKWNTQDKAIRRIVVEPTTVPEIIFANATEPVTSR